MHPICNSVQYTKTQYVLLYQVSQPIWYGMPGLYASVWHTMDEKIWKYWQSCYKDCNRTKSHRLVGLTLYTCLVLLRHWISCLQKIIKLQLQWLVHRNHSLMISAEEINLTLFSMPFVCWPLVLHHFAPLVLLILGFTFMLPSWHLWLVVHNLLFALRLLIYTWCIPAFSFPIYLYSLYLSNCIPDINTISLQVICCRTEEALYL